MLNTSIQIFPPVVLHPSLTCYSSSDQVQTSDYWKVQRHIRHWRCCYLWNQQCEGCDWITQEGFNARQPKSLQLRACRLWIIISCRWSLAWIGPSTVGSSAMKVSDVITDNISFRQHCLWKYFRMLFKQEVDFHTYNQTIHIWSFSRDCLRTLHDHYIDQSEHISWPLLEGC